MLPACRPGTPSRRISPTAMLPASLLPTTLHTVPSRASTNGHPRRHARPLTRAETLHVLGRRERAHVHDASLAHQPWQRVAYALGEDALYARAWRARETVDPARPTSVEFLVNDLTDASLWRMVRVYGALSALAADGGPDEHREWQGAIRLLRPRVPALRHPEPQLTGVVLLRISIDTLSGVEQPLEPEPML